LVVRLATIYLKEGTGRLRPTEWLAKSGDPWWRDAGIAFPSGDVTLVASLAIPVILLWPRARPLPAGMLAVPLFPVGGPRRGQRAVRRRRHRRAHAGGAGGMGGGVSGAPVSTLATAVVPAMISAAPATVAQVGGSPNTTSCQIIASTIWR